VKIIAQNKKAFFDYEILETYEAGVVLTGDEVKSIRAGHVSLGGSYATVNKGSIVLLNCDISPYSKAYRQPDDTFRTRTRTLLLKKREINRLIGDISQKGVTVLPLKVYINERGYIKIELGVGKHKKAAGKKEALKERDIKRETARELKNYRS
jgi:SsrA-binding protein